MCAGNGGQERKRNPGFVKTPFYRVVSTIDAQGHQFEGEWKAVKGSRYFESYDLYKENGFKEREKAEELIRFLLEGVDQKEGPVCRIESIEKKKEKKIHRFYIIWQNCRMTVPKDLRSVRMRRCGLCRNCMKRSL